MKNEAKPCRILSLDGGGIKVGAQVVMLARIFGEFPELFNQIDVFAGTSAGALLALALAKNGPEGLLIFTPQTIVDMFQRSYSYKVFPSYGLTASEYSNRALDAFLTKEFAEQTISDLPRKVFVPAFKLSSPPKDLASAPGPWHPESFSNIGDKEDKTLIKDVALRTTAAPTFFPIYQNYTDGGVTANSPAAFTVTHCKKNGYSLDGMRVLSLSGGMQNVSITEENAKWGVSSWASYIVDMLIDGNMFVSDMMCKELLGNRYFRYELPFGGSVSLDGTEQLAALMEAAKTVDLSPIYEWIRKEWL